MQTSYDNKSCQQLMLNTLKHLRSLKLSRFEPIHKCMGQVWSCKKGKKTAGNQGNHQNFDPTLLAKKI